MKIFVAIPVYDGKLPVQTVISLLNEKTVALGNGDDLQIAFLPNCSHPAMGRNQLVQQFLESDCDKLFFLDSDITFEPGSLLSLCYKPFDFVSGVYRFKMDEEQYPITYLDKPFLEANKFGLLEVQTIPAGFMALSRNVFETIKKSKPEMEYEHFGKKAYCYFQYPFSNGLHSEESYFCHLWRAAGGQVFIDPEIKLTHWNFNPTPYVGHIGNYLKNRPKDIKENHNA